MTVGFAMSDEHQHAEGPAQSPGFLGRIRRYFLTGLVVFTPIAVTAYIAWNVIDFVDEQIKPLIPIPYNPDTYLPFSLPGLGLLLLGIFLVLLGMVTARAFGRSLLGLGERIVDTMPVVRTLYGALKNIIETVFNSDERNFEKAALIEYPRRGLWAIVFITSKTKGEVAQKIPDPLVSVFLPTTPNPTSGFLLFVPESDLIPLDMTVEQAARMIISGGIINEEKAKELSRQAGGRPDHPLQKDHPTP